MLKTITALTASSVALALSDGTPVQFVKITSRDRIQVRLPADHALANEDDGGSDPSLRIFTRDGNHFKDRTELTLIATPAAVAPAAPTPAAAPAPTWVGANDNTTYTVAGNSFTDLGEAKDEAIDLFRETGRSIDIVAITTKVVGTVGFTLAA